MAPFSFRILIPRGPDQVRRRSLLLFHHPLRSQSCRAARLSRTKASSLASRVHSSANSPGCHSRFIPYLLLHCQIGDAHGRLLLPRILPAAKHDSQRAEIQRWLRNHGMRSSRVQWFEDTETGKTLKRPAFDRLQQDIFAGTVKTVVVWKLDRLSRRQRDGVNLLADWCERGVRVVVVPNRLT
jgi:Resolvase, N terminal domain